MSAPSVIRFLAVTAPSNVLAQRELGKRIIRALPPHDKARIAFTRRLYGEAGGIEYRRTVLSRFPGPGPEGTFIPDTPRKFNGPSTKNRNAVYAEKAPELARQAARNALESIDPNSVTHLITASCTGFFAPGIDIALMLSLGLSPHVKRMHLGFMGCFAALPALSMADSICRANGRKTRVLVVCVELCSLHYRHVFSRPDMVANALFADGAAAAVVEPAQAIRGKAPRPLFGLRSFHSTLLENSMDQMSWTIGNNGFIMGLSASVPRSIGSSIKETVVDTCKAVGTPASGIDCWAVHPGGRAILDAVEQRLGLSHTALSDSRDVLRDFGNMSSATLLFVLKKIAEKKQPGKQVFAAAFGPGLTAETALLETL